MKYSDTATVDDTTSAINEYKRAVADMENTMSELFGQTSAKDYREMCLIVTAEQRKLIRRLARFCNTYRCFPTVRWFESVPDVYYADE